MTSANPLAGKDWRLVAAVAGGAAAAAVAAGWFVSRKLAERRLDEARLRWLAVDKDVVVLHTFPRPNTSISMSPFVAKLEAFLRLAEVKYIVDDTFPYSPDTGKSPWITIDGREISDSQMIMENIAKKFGKEFSTNLSPKEKCVARSLRILLEDHFYWAFVAERYVYQEARYIKDMVHPRFGTGRSAEIAFESYRRSVVAKLTSQCYAQGLTRTGKGNVHKNGIEDLEALSTFLGSKSYMMGGEKPTELDCVVFGFISCVCHTTPKDCVYRVLVEKRLTNLVQHMNRLKMKLFPDWNDIVKQQDN